MATAANYAPAHTRVAFMGTSANVASYRRSGRSEVLEYSEAQRKRMVQPEEEKEN
jgi:hypothetical protein